MRRVLAVVLLALVAAAGGCGGGSASTVTSAGAPQGRTDVLRALGRGGFDPAGIYRREAPGVVTVLSVADGSRGQGSGFVVSDRGEVVTNAHVVTRGEGAALREASEVYVEFADDDQVAARIVGTDPDSDVALLRVDPRGLTLRPLPLGSSTRLVVGSPVAAMGSPFGEPQSLSVGVISALDRTIDSLTTFEISDAIQTDAAINRGNSGGPLVNARGEVIGVNSQIRSTGGGGEGVGFAVPVDTVKRSVAALRATGRVRYAFIGVTSAPVYPQLARRFRLGARRGAWIQTVTGGGPAARAGIRGGSREVRFQARSFAVGGDVITKVQDDPVRGESDLSRALGRRRPGDRVTVELWRDEKRRTLEVTLGARVSQTP